MTLVSAVPAGWGPDTEAVINTFDAVRRRLAKGYVGRDRAIRLLQLAVLCREHMLLLGPPGTAKTDLVLRFADLIAARKFAYLLTRFTEPSEVFGPLDFDAFHNSDYRVRITGMLPDAQVAFLDEVFQGSSAILNSLLTLINERVFHNGPVPTRTPLVTLIGAANDLPDDPVLRAFADRFLLRAELTSVAQEHLHDLLALGWEREHDALRRPLPAVPVPVAESGSTLTGEQHMIAIEDLTTLSDCVAQVDLEPVLLDYEDVIRELLAARVVLSDRRVVRGQKLVAGAAVLRNSAKAEPKDLWPLTHFWADRADVAVFEEIVQSRVEADGGAELRIGRTVRQIYADAVLEHQHARRRLSDGQIAPSILSRSLSRLNELKNEMVRTHQDAGAEIGKIQDMVDDLIGAL